MANLFSFIRPRFRPQSEDIKSAAIWGVTVVAGAIWVIQPFNYLKKTFFEDPKPES